MGDLISDLDALAQAGARPGGRECTVGFVLRQVTPEQRQRLVALIDESPVPATELSAVLQKHGFNVRDHAILRHRRRHSGQSGCVCP